MNWRFVSKDTLVLKAWKDALQETFPSAVPKACTITHHDPDEVIFYAIDIDTAEVLRVPMTADLLIDLVFSVRPSSDCPDAYLAPLYELLLSQLRQAKQLIKNQEESA